MPHECGDPGRRRLSGHEWPEASKQRVVYVDGRISVDMSGVGAARGTQRSVRGRRVGVGGASLAVALPLDIRDSSV